MEEDILREILQEMKGFRIDLKGTNDRLDILTTTTNSRFEELTASSNSTNSRLDELTSSVNKRFDGLTASMVIMQQEFSDMRIQLVQIKKFLSDRVIWNNDSIFIDTESGSKIQGVIHKSGEL